MYEVSKLASLLMSRLTLSELLRVEEAVVHVCCSYYGITLFRKNAGTYKTSLWFELPVCLLVIIGIDALKVRVNTHVNTSF